MSDRAVRLRRAYAAVALLGAAAPAQVCAQQVRAQQHAVDYPAQVAHARELYRASLRHTDALEATVDSLKEERRRTHTTDSVRAGAILVRVVGDSLPASSRAALGRAVTGAWQVMTQFHDTTVSPLVSSTPLELRVHTRRTPLPARSMSIGFTTQSTGDRFLGERIEEDKARIALLELYGGVVGSRLPRSLVKWTTSEWVPLASPTTDDWQRVATELATSRSSLARSCLTTEAAACRTIVDLDDAPLTDVRATWYRPVDYPALVADWVPRDSANQALRTRCVHDGVAAACEAAVQLMPVVRPVGTFPKMALLMLAIERGGDGALDRLMNAKGSPAEILSATAKVPMHELLVAWRAAVQGAPVPRSTPGVAELAAVAIWTLAFGSLATRRRP